MRSICEAYRRRADQCEAAAARVRDPDIRATYLDVAARWRRKAEQQEAIDRALSARRRSAEFLQKQSPAMGGADGGRGVSGGWGTTAVS